MKVKISMIDRDLRTVGRMMKLLNFTFTEPGMRLLHKLQRAGRPRMADDQMQISEKWVSRSDGSQMRICIFRPLSPTGHAPGVLWLHGGGYALGTPDQSRRYARALMAASDCVVVAPDYRLSCEAPYPAALSDSYQALLWMKSHASELGIDDSQLMVGGDSAGGGLVAALTFYARDRGEVNIAFQMPLYPMLDDRMATESARDNNAPVWNSRSNAAGWRLYLGDLCGAPNLPYYAAAARATDYRHLPPTATFVGDLEPFRDEVVQYVADLRSAGVPVEFALYSGCYHGFDQVCPHAAVSRQATLFLMTAFQHAARHLFAAQPEQQTRGSALMT